MNVFIVEDERLGMERLVNLLKEIDPDMIISGHADSIRSAVKWLRQNHTPNLIFMDIELADGQCFEIFNQIEIGAPIIFTTSYDEYALQAFRVNSIDYLLKPIKKVELTQSLEKYRNLKAQFSALLNQVNLENLVRELKHQSRPAEFRKRFLVKQGQRLLSIETRETAYFFADGKICFLKTWDNRRFVVDYTLEQLSEMLDPTEFFRVNRSYIVNINAIKGISNYFNGKLILQLTPPSETNDVIVSKEKAMAFKRWMGK